MPKTETFNKEEVIKMATEVFHSKSYSLTSMQDLVDATGLNRSSIYNSFGSKLDLYMLCLKDYQYTLKCNVEKVLINSNSSFDAIELIFKLNTRKSKENNTGCLINNCTSEMANQEDIIKDFLNSNHENIVTLFKYLIKKGQQEGSINNMKPSSIYALYLVNSLQGLSVSNILMNDCNDIENIVTTTLSILR